MKRLFKILKWTSISIISILILGILFVRFSRLTDKMIYQTNNNYEVFESNFNHQVFHIPLDNEIRIHAVLFKPDSIKSDLRYSLFQANNGERKAVLLISMFSI